MMPSFVRIIILILVSTVLPIYPTHGAEPIKIGVLAFRPKPQTLAQWQPLAAALKDALPEHDFVVEVFTFPELETAVSNRQIDFVLTNPGHYVLLTKRIGLSAPLATLAVDQDNQPISLFGGVIFTRAGQTDINTLSDIKGKTVSAVSTDSFGGYQMQAFELSKIGIRIPQDVKLITTGMPHDNVIETVLAGRADVGFVRSGVVEQLAHESKLDLNQLKIVNLKRVPGFPQQISTQLYPEWAFAVLPHVDSSLARHVAAALYVLEDNTAAVRTMGIHGFVVSPDYTPVADLLKELRLPPFDDVPSFTLQDVWTRYFKQILVALVAVGFILLLSIRLLVTSQKLKLQQRTLLLQKTQLQESELHLHTIIENEPECIKIMNSQGRLIQMNPAGLAMIEADSFSQVAGKSLSELVTPEYRTAFAKLYKNVLDGESKHLEFEIQGLKGGHRWLETHAVPMHQNNEVVILAVTRDITERKLAGDALHKSHQNMHSLLNSMAEGAYGVDTEGNCTFVNRSFLRILGYDAPEEIIGKHIHELIHYAYTDGRHYPAAECKVYCVMQTNQELCCLDEVFWSKDGKAIPVEYWSQPIVTEGKIQGSITTFIDITERKKEQEAIRQSELKFRTLYDTTSDAVQMLDEKGFLDCNQATLVLFGCSSRNEFCTYHPANLSPPKQPNGQDSMTLANYYITTAMKEGSARFEWVHKRADTGQPFSAEVLLNSMLLNEKLVLLTTVRDISERKAREEQIHNLAYYDPLTQLPNRRLLNERLSQTMMVCKRNGRYGALMFMDLDNFKALNDTYGHAAGDLLLIEAAQRICRCIRETDTVARFGGDEFVVMLSELDESKALSITQASIIAEKIRMALAETYWLIIQQAGKERGTIEHQCTSSIGVTLFNNNDLNPQDVIRIADMAMYEAKDSGCNRIVVKLQ